MISDAIKAAFRKKNERGWDKWPRIYWAIDLHDVIIPGTYTRNNEGRAFYPDAKEVLQWLSLREDMCIILYTSSYSDAIHDINEWLFQNGIKVNYVNENPECVDTKLCSFAGKWYMDILLDDKAGFVGITDWGEIKKTLEEINEWHKKIKH